jgi:hypothetical protein
MLHAASRVKRYGRSALQVQSVRMTFHRSSIGKAGNGTPVETLSHLLPKGMPEGSRQRSSIPPYSTIGR